jgi:hypothetical protein
LNTITYNVNVAGVTAALHKYEQALGLYHANIGTPAPGFAKLLHDETGLLTMRVMAATPPGGPGIAPPAAKKIGEKAVMRDLLKFFQPVELKGRRRISQVFGHPMKTAVFVVTKEKWPDVEQIHREEWLAHRGPSAHRRGPRAKFYVDVKKFRALAKTLTELVGYTAAGWAPAALELGRRVPAWIRRWAERNRRNTVQIDLAGAHPGIRITNDIAEGADPRKVEQRLNYFLKVSERSLLRRANILMNQAKRMAGL